MLYEKCKNIDPLIFSSEYINKVNKKKINIFINSFNYNFFKLAFKEFLIFSIQKIINKKIDFKNKKNIFFSVTNINNNKDIDEYFGNFNKYFNENIIINVDIKLKKIKKTNSISLLAQLSLKDFFEIIIDQYEFYKKYLKKNKKNTNKILKLFYEIKNILNASAIYKIISKTSQKCFFYYIFENEPWERALLISLNEKDKIQNTFAFTHTLISKNNSNYINLYEIQKEGLFPKNIISTGRYNIENLIDISRINTDDVNFYHTNINKLNKRIKENNKRNKSILFLIDDIKYLKNLYFIMHQLYKRNNFKIYYSFNIHDNQISTAIKRYDLSFMEKLNFNNDKYINVSIVIYNSTSLALEFYKKGYFLAYFDYYNNKEYDPMSKTYFNKDSFRNYNELNKLLLKAKPKAKKIRLIKEYLYYFGNNSDFKFKKINNI